MKAGKKQKEDFFGLIGIPAWKRNNRPCNDEH
jgi:hypothetical protein